MSTVKTTIKCDVCSFSEYRIYPGRGKKFVAKDGKIQVFIGKKPASLSHQRIKPVKLTWTPAWRRMNKKGRAEVTQRKRTKKSAKIQKAIVGLALDEIKRKRATVTKTNNDRTSRDAAIAVAKEQKRQATRQAINQAAKAGTDKAKQAKQTKHQASAQPRVAVRK